MVCGEVSVNNALLRSATDYCGYSASDQVVAMLWEVLDEFSQGDRRAFLKFTWGRTRLPLTLDGFKQRMKVSRQYRSDPDAYLPVILKYTYSDLMFMCLFFGISLFFKLV